MAPQVVQQAFEVEEVLHAELHQSALNDLLHLLENCINSRLGRRYLVWVGSER